MKSKHLNLKSCGGEVITNGQVDYPYYINIDMERWKALDIIQSLVSQLQNSNRNNYHILVWGKLKEEANAS